MKILGIVGARPNFIKMAPLCRAFRKYPDIHFKLVHTGQHADFRMSGVFFQQLGLQEPDYFLGVTGGTHAGQTANMMLAFEKVLEVEKPDLVLVVGDVNSTLACTLVAAKENVPVAHVEAGLRSGDRTMPEEINRILTDAISDQLFITEMTAYENLLLENIPASRIHFVGNVMIDSLVHCRERISLADGQQKHVLVTMHRPVNVDTQEGLARILDVIVQLSHCQKVLFIMHPRTEKNLAAFGLRSRLGSLGNCRLLPPQGYFEFLNLVNSASLVVTDSGGVQEETTFLNIPCITLRNSTERPVTVELGTNYLLPDFTTEAVLDLAKVIWNSGGKKGKIPPFWDGLAAERIAAILKDKQF